MVAILALHAAAGWGLLQVDAVRSAVAEAAPLFVDLIAPPAPEKPAEPPPPPPRPLTKTAPPPAPLIAAAPAPTPAPPAFVAPEPPPEPVQPAPREPVVVAVAPPAPPAPPASAPPAPPAPPRELPASAIQYLDPPAPVYPRASRRNGEAGLVVVRVFVGVDGVPRQLQLLRSSGFARLDEAALEGVRQARFKPPTENGRALSGWARIPIPFELEQ